jgi:uncharacterized protein (TIGR03067 family)
MKTSLILFLLPFLCCSQLADAGVLDGSWRMKYTEAGGRKHFVAKAISITLTIRDSTWTSVVNPSYPNASGFRAKFATNDAKTPKQIDLHVTSGTPGTVWKGIYEIQDDTLKVCRTRLSSRPTRFVSSSDASVIVEVYERIAR